MKVFHYPQGSPYGSRAWPELNWRSLLRHVYRQQRFWNDLADLQPPSEQHACLMQFLGLAEMAFSPRYGELVQRQKRIVELQATKDRFLETLHQVSRDLLDGQVSVALTSQSLASARMRLESRLKAIDTERGSRLSELVSAVEKPKTNKQGAPVQQGPSANELSGQLAAANTRLDTVNLEITKCQQRLAEVGDYGQKLREELARLDRTEVAGSLLGAMAVTHCPACDQAIARSKTNGTSCYLCHQPSPTAAITNEKRLEFERQQIRSELTEAGELAASLRKDEERLLKDLSRARDEIGRLQALLRPTRQAIANVLPPEIGMLDVESGQVQERLRQLDHVTGVFAMRETLSKQIQTIENEVLQLEQTVATEHEQLNFETAGDLITDGLNTYLNAIKQLNPHSWSKGEASFRISDKKISLKVGNASWQYCLGGTLSLYFFLAYHYSLFALSERADCHFPGLLILDFPPTLEDGSSVKDKENFVLQPFLAKLTEDSFRHTQIIAAGNAFEGLAAANRIELHEVW
jgi:hypothetical protein